VTAIAELAGEVIAVDEVSLIRDEPIRVKIRAREVSKISGSLECFVEGVGFFIKFTPEKRAHKADPVEKPPPPHDKKPDDDNMDDDDKDFLYDSDEDLNKKSQEDGEGGHLRRIAEELKITRGKGAVMREGIRRRSSWTVGCQLWLNLLFPKLCWPMEKYWKWSKKGRLSKSLRGVEMINKN
jgi:hypothetical protein